MGSFGYLPLNMGCKIVYNDEIIVTFDGVEYSCRAYYFGLDPDRYPDSYMIDGYSYDAEENETYLFTIVLMDSSNIDGFGPGNVYIEDDAESHTFKVETATQHMPIKNGPLVHMSYTSNNERISRYGSIIDALQAISNLADLHIEFSES